MRFLIDAQLPPALVARLRGERIDAVHVVELGLGGAADAAIWERACAEGWIIMSKDMDFIEHMRRSPSGAAIVWIRLGNTTTSALWAHLRPILPDILAALSRGERLVEII